MKYLILVLALFAAFALTAQDSIRVTLYADSTYIIENIYNDEDGIPTRVDVVRANGPTELAGYFYAVANQAFADYPGTGVHQIRILKPGFIRVLQGGVQLADLYLQGRRYISFDGRYTLRINQLTIQNR